MENKGNKIEIGKCLFETSADCTRLSTTVTMPKSLTSTFRTLLVSDIYDTGLICHCDAVDIGNNRSRNGMSMLFVPTDSVNELVDFSHMFRRAIELMLDKALLIRTQLDLQAPINKKLDALILDAERVKYKSTSVESVVIGNTKNNDVTEKSR